MPRSYVKISDTVDFGIPRSDSSSCTASRWSLLIAASTCFNILRGSACCRPSRTWISFNRFSTIFEAFCHNFICAALIVLSLKAFWITCTVSVEECSSLTQNLMKIRCSTHSVILNVMATQYTCSLNGVYHPCWLGQWSCHCSRMRIPVHSPWLPGHIDVTQTILVILTTAGLFPDRPHMCENYSGDECEKTDKSPT